MPIRASVGTHAVSPSRGAHRVQLRLEVRGSFEEGGQTSALVHNLSATGILIETAEALLLDQRIAIDLPEAGQVSATVVWISERLAGCRFDRPLSKAVLSATQLLNPSVTEAPPVSDFEDASSRELLAKHLLDLRRRRGLSRAALAERAGLSAPSLWAWETGRVSPRRKNLLALARALEVSERELLPDDVEARFEDKDRSAHQEGVQSLEELIRSTKQQIASAAGVDVASVKITIEL